MDFSEWSSITALAHRVIGSLGPTKADLESTNDFVYRAPAIEQNLLRNISGYVLQAIGLPSGYATDSIRGVLADHETRIGDIETDGTTLHAFGRFAVDVNFMGTADASYPGDEFFDESGGGVFAPKYVGGRGGGIYFPADEDYEVTSTKTPCKRGDNVEVQFGVALSGYPAADDNRFFRFSDAGLTNQFGIQLDLTGHKVRGFVNTGGIVVETDVGTYVSGAESKIHAWISGNHWYVSVDDAAGVDCGIVPDVTYQCTCWSIHDHTCGRMRVRLFKVRADFSTAEAMPGV